MKPKYYSDTQVASIIEKLPGKEYFEMLNAFTEEPSADVVDKERYARLLANAIIVSNALKEYRTADFVKVVRCKDCKWSVEHYDTDGNVPYWVCKNWDGGTDADGFRYEGERKEDVEETD